MALIDLDTLKTFLGISGTSQDTLLTIYLNATNKFINNYCKRTLEATDYSEELYDGTGHAALILKNYPIISVTEVLVDTEEVEERTDVGETGYYINSESGILYNDELWQRGRGNTQVTYRAGYESDSIPADLTLACLQLGAYMYNMGKRAGIRGESLGSYSYSLASEANSLAAPIPVLLANLLLSGYRKRDLGIVY